MKEFLKTLVAAQQKLEPLIESVQKFQNSVPKINPQIVELVANLHSKIPTIDPVLMASLQRTAERFNHIAKILNNVDFSFNIENDLVRYTELLIRLEMPPLKEIEYSTMKELIGIEDVSVAKNILVQHMLRIYDEQKIDCMFNAWRLLSVSQKRIHIFEEVIWAHQNKKYNVSIPTLMAQFEGLICDITNSNRLKDKVLQQHVVSILQSDDIYQDANISKEFWINVLLDNKSDNERFLSRHAILHGEDINYGNYEKSLILIIAMDAVLEWLDIVQNTGVR